MDGRLARVGITGGIAEGKSTVLRYLRETGYRVASADDIAREQLQDPTVRQRVASVAGLKIDFSPVDLRDRLLAEVAVRRAVNSVMHPLVIAGLAAARVDFIEIPLLIETALQQAFDEVWVVTCGPDEQRRRLVERISDASLAERVLEVQLPTEAKLPFADVIVRTNAPAGRVKAYTLESVSSAIKLGVANRSK